MLRSYKDMASLDGEIADLAKRFNADVSDGSVSDNTCHKASGTLGSVDGADETLAAQASKIRPYHENDLEHMYKLYGYLGARAGAIADACMAVQQGRSYASILQSGSAAKKKYRRYYPQWAPKL